MKVIDFLKFNPDFKGVEKELESHPIIDMLDKYFELALENHDDQICEKQRVECSKHFNDGFCFDTNCYECNGSLKNNQNIRNF